VVDRYKGVIPSWDVVNEVIAHDPLAAGPLRDTVWLRLLGPGYIETAFKTAARVDPAARLVLNDYDFENPDPRTRARREEALKIIRRLKDKGIPVHTVGFQAHLYGEREIDGAGLQQFCADLAKLEVGTVVTELDVIDWRLPANIATRDRAAASLVQSFLAAMWVSNKPESIITWGLSDSNSWISTTFKREDKLANRPLPLDVDNRPKAMLRVIERFTRGKA
jgi:endo-1,4-beta-xylanase